MTDQASGKQTGSRPTRPWLVFCTAAATLAVLAGCASGPNGSSSPGTRSYPNGRDGGPTSPPDNLDQVRDAEPRIETVRTGGPNKPYNLFGRSYTPRPNDEPFEERGLASWYGTKFHGQPTASGELYDMYAMTAAHPTLPIPSYARIRNPANGREIVVRVNDRGPFHSGRIVDLSYTAAHKLGLLRGVATVELKRITPDEIRAGVWKRGARPADDIQVASVSANAEVQALAPPAAAAPWALPPTRSTPTPGLSATTSAADRMRVLTPTPTPTQTAPDASAANSGSASAAAPPLPTAQPSTDEPNGTDIALTATSSGIAATAAAAQADPAPIFGTPETALQTSKTKAGRGFWIQLGAFRQRNGAETLHHRAEAAFDWLAPLLAVFNDQSLYRVQAGPYPSQDEARRVAQQLASGLGLRPVIVDKR